MTHEPDLTLDQRTARAARRSVLHAATYVAAWDDPDFEIDPDDLPFDEPEWPPPRGAGGDEPSPPPDPNSPLNQ